MNEGKILVGLLQNNLSIENGKESDYSDFNEVWGKARVGYFHLAEPLDPYLHAPAIQTRI